MPYAISNLPIAVTTSTPPTGVGIASYRAVNVSTDCTASEVFTDTTPPQFPMFDWSIVNPLNSTVAPIGYGDVRAATSAELSAITATNTAAQTQYQADVATLKADYTAISNAVSTSTYPTTVSALCGLLFPFLLCLLRVIDVIATDQQQPL